MTPRRHVRFLLAIGLIAGLLAMTIGTVIEAMSAGSIQGQEGWSGGTMPIAAAVDQTIDLSGLNQRTGTGAWRISNNTSLGNHNGAFAGWVFSPGLPVSAGQPSSGAGADQFTATLWFRSASASADGSNLEVDLGSVAGDDRNNLLALTNGADADGGLRVRVNEPLGATGNFRPAIIATGIARSVWHRLDIVANFQDGLANDTVEYALDGVALANPAGGMTFATFEGYFQFTGQAYVLSNRLYFRSGAAPSAFGAFVDTAAQGFFFDDLFYSVANQAAPAFRLAAYATGFEPGMSPGSIQTQEDWSGGTLPIAASVDQTVDQAGLNHRTGSGAWRISNNTSLGGYNGNFAGWPFSPGLPVSAGQPSSGAGADQFTATLWFRSASAAADGSNIEVDLGTVPGDDRNSFLALTNRADVDGGLQLRVSEPDGATGGFRPTVVVAMGIARGVYHRLDIVANFQDGPANDTVAYALDGVSLANPVGGGMTFGTFEGFRDGMGSPYVLSNRLFFRSGAAPSAFGAFADAAAQGFFFDDLFYAVAHQSAPATPLAAYATGFEPSTIPAPDLTISKSHVGNFIQGQIGAQFTVTVTNSGPSSTIGVVTLIDAVPAVFTPTTGTGTGWICTVAGAMVTCTRSDALAPLASYPPVTITVNVAASAPASVTNTATISGGGEVNTANNTATDVTTVLPAIPPGPGVLTEVASFFAYDVAFAGGVSVAVGDVTGDGVADLITGAGPGGGPHIRVFSMAGGAPTEVASFFAYNPAFPGGVSVAAGDVTGDGVAEIITGAGPGGGPHVRAFSVAGGIVTEVAGFFAFDPGFPGGVSVATGDVNGDGVAEIIAGAGAGGAPHVRIFSLMGGTATEVTNFFAYDPAFPGGVSVAAGDVTGDGVAEIITGAGAGGGPHVRVFSLAGTVATEVASFFAYDPAFPGGVFAAAGDISGDGVAEIITGAGSSGGPHVRAFSLTGGTPTEVTSFFAYDPAFPGGVSVAAGDITGDGLAEIITGAGPSGGPHVRVLNVNGGTVP